MAGSVPIWSKLVFITSFSMMNLPSEMREYLSYNHKAIVVRLRLRVQVAFRLRIITVPPRG
jgi:hypothetical protein